MSAMTGTEITEMIGEGFVTAEAWCPVCAATADHLVGEPDGEVEAWCTGCQADTTMPALTLDEAICALLGEAVFATRGTYWPAA